MTTGHRHRQRPRIGPILAPDDMVANIVRCVGARRTGSLHSDILWVVSPGALRAPRRL
jgi:hypothetical protein